MKVLHRKYEYESSDTKVDDKQQTSLISDVTERSDDWDIKNVTDDLYEYLCLREVNNEIYTLIRYLPTKIIPNIWYEKRE